DQTRIDALEWMSYSARASSSSRAEVIAFSNALARAYVLDRNIVALAALFDKLDAMLPSLLADVRADLAFVADSSADADTMLREHVSLRQYYHMHVAYRDWYRVWLNRPLLPPSPQPDELRQHFAVIRYKELLRQFERQMEHWAESAADLTERIVAAVKSIV